MVTVTPSGPDDASGFLALLTDAVLPDPRKIDEGISRLRAANPNLGRDELVDLVVRKSIWLSTGAGVVSSLPAVAPGVGTAVGLGTSLSMEVVLMLRNLTTMQLAIAHLYELPIMSPEDKSQIHEDRRQEVLLVWGILLGVLEIKKVTSKATEKIVAAQISKRISGKTLAKINQAVGTTLLTKYGAKRGLIQIGKVIPAGVGVAVSGGFAYSTARSFSRAAEEFYRRRGDDPETGVALVPA